MSCPFDKAYTDPFPGGDYCNAAGGLYKNCQGNAYGTGWEKCTGSGTGGPYPLHGQPPCCPKGSSTTCEQHDCGNLLKKWNCVWNPPTQFNDDAKVNCCLNQNLPSSGPVGYCAAGWCPGSANCQSFMKQYCVDSKLNTNECINFCKSYLGACDVSLKFYCSDKANFGKSVCGCALPVDQYPLSKFTTPDAPSIPVKCNTICALNSDAVPLKDQPDCDIKTICVINANIDIAEKSSIGGITFDQNCGNSPNTNGFSAIFKKYWYVFLIIFIVIVVLIILLVIFV